MTQTRARTSEAVLPILATGNDAYLTRADTPVRSVEATRSLIALEAALEDGTAAGDGERRRVVAGYNEDDCRATLALRDWLEERRAELAGRLGQELPRPTFAEKPGAAEDPETARIRSALLAGVSAETSGAIAWDVSAETSEGRARALLADLLDWHRREDKPAWWRYFYLRTLSPAELIGEPDALGGLSGGEMVGQVKRSVVRRFRFPAQEHKFSPGGTACDPATDKQWSVCDVDDARGTIDLKMGSTYSGPWPAALTEVGPPRTWETWHDKNGTALWRHGHPADDGRSRVAGRSSSMPITRATRSRSISQASSVASCRRATAAIMQSTRPRGVMPACRHRR